MNDNKMEMIDKKEAHKVQIEMKNMVDYTENKVVTT